MFPRFLQVFLDKQVEGMAKHKEIYVISSHTKKIFTNMRRQGHGFSGNVTPLFKTMMVNAQEEVGEDSSLHTDSHHTPTDTQPSSSKPLKKIKPKRKQRQATEVHSSSSEIPVEQSIPTPFNDLLHSGEGWTNERVTRVVRGTVHRMQVAITRFWKVYVARNGWWIQLSKAGVR
nr:hypothetical protein [Tanacetum cinerariifolium]